MYIYKGGNAVKIIFLPSEKGSTLIRKFFRLRIDPFSIGVSMQKSKQEVTKVVSLAKMAKYFPGVSSFINQLLKVPNYGNTPIQIYRKFHLQKW